MSETSGSDRSDPPSSTGGDRSAAAEPESLRPTAACNATDRAGQYDSAGSAAARASESSRGRSRWLAGVAPIPVATTQIAAQPPGSRRIRSRWLARAAPIALATTRIVAQPPEPGPVRRRSLAGVAPILLTAAWVAAQIMYPLAHGAARDRITVGVVLLSTATALTHAAGTRGIRYAAGLLTIVSGLGLLAEILGTATGFPFGCYDYADGRIGPALAGVPLLVPLAWTGGLYPVWVVAGLLTRRRAVRVGLTAVGAVGWDLFLDPQMVADGQWTWCASAPGLPGIAQIPYTNYLGWFAVALVMAGLLSLLEQVSPRPAGMPGVPVAVFLWTWLGSVLAHAAFLGLPYSAWYGGVGLGILGIPLLLAGIRRGHGGVVWQSGRPAWHDVSRAAEP